MITRTESRVLPYPAELLYRVTADVERYPEFLPWCRRLRVLQRTETETGAELLAEMTVGFSALCDSYVSQVILNDDACTISVTQTRGPFRRLMNRWAFAETEGGARVDFFIAFEIRNPFLQMAVAGAFDSAVRKMSAAFAARAAELAKTKS